MGGSNQIKMGQKLVAKEERKAHILEGLTLIEPQQKLDLKNFRGCAEMQKCLSMENGFERST